jgi:hypothetical protein
LLTLNADGADKSALNLRPEIRRNMLCSLVAFHVQVGQFRSDDVERIGIIVASNKIAATTLGLMQKRPRTNRNQVQWISSALNQCRLKLLLS